MGGTEILEPLKELFTQTKRDDLPKNVFLITDGCVGNTKEVVDLI